MKNWTAAGHELPQYGFYARVPAKGGLTEAAIERRDGTIVEWSRSSEAWYVNARPVVFDKPPARRGGGSGAPRFDTGPDPRPARMNPDNKVVAFGAVFTNGAVRLTRAGDALVLTPLPNSPAFTLRLRWAQLPWKLAEPKDAEALDQEGRVLRRVPLESRAGEIQLTCEPDVFAYRLR